MDFFKLRFQELIFGRVIDNIPDTVKEWRSSRSKYVKSFKLVLDFKVLLPLNKRAVLLRVRFRWRFILKATQAEKRHAL